MKSSRLGVAMLAAALAGLALAGLAAAAAPGASTGPVTGSGQTSATVTGTVDPNGLATTWHFEYGKTTSYGSATGAVNAGAGTTATGVSSALDGLTPGTTYHYRLVATNSSGTTQGADAVLTTSGAPAPDAVTGAASSLSATGATLNGSVNPNGRTTSWHFEYGTSTSYGSSTATQSAGAGTTAVNASAAVSGLVTGRTYHFRLVASSDGGTTRGADQTFKPESPPAVSTSAATSVATTSATLNGRVNPNGQSTTWHFDYGTTTSYGSATGARDAGSGTGTSSVSVTVLGLTPGVTYHFRLVAVSAAGTSVGADQSFTTPGAPVATTGAAQNVGTTVATLTGAVDNRNRTASWYFEYGTSTRYGLKTATQTAGAALGAQGVSAGIGSLAAGTAYHFRLVATNSLGTSRGADVVLTTVANTVTLAASSFKVVNGHFVMLSGTLSTGQTGVTVTVLAQRFGDTAFAPVTTVQTGAGGRWTYLAGPTIATSYQVTASGVPAPSATVTVGVRPSLSLRRVTGDRFSTHVGGEKPFTGRFVQFQRLSGDRWVTVRRARLNAASNAFFKRTLVPKGRSTIRIAFSVNQAGPGFLAGFSRELTVIR